MVVVRMKHLNSLSQHNVCHTVASSGITYFSICGLCSNPILRAHPHLGRGERRCNLEAGLGICLLLPGLSDAKFIVTSQRDIFIPQPWVLDL